MADPTIFHFNAERRDIVDAVVARVVSETHDPLLTLNEAAYTEIKRLEPNPKGEREKLARFHHLARSVGRMSDGERMRKLEELAREYAWDVAGNFNPRVYKFASRVLPSLVSFLTS